MPTEHDDTKPRRLAGADGKRAARRGLIAWVKVYPDDHQHHGKPISCVENMEVLLAHYGVRAGFCLMQHRAVIDAGLEVASERRNNATRAQIREWARANQYPTGKSFDDQIEIVISRNWSHPVADWIRQVTWDGVDRFEAMFASLDLHPAFAEAQRPLAFRMFCAWVITAARAAMLPASVREGIAAQGVLVLQGPQGCGKSRWIKALVPPERGAWVKEACVLDPSNRDSLQAATKAWITEIGELDGTFRKSDIAALKAFLTSQTDTYHKAYDLADEDIARRTVFAASVNDSVFLADDTGSRRFWVLRVTSANPDHGVDLHQLWAQAAALGAADPSLGWLSGTELDGLAESNQTFSTIDPLLESLCRTWKTTEADTWSTLDEIKLGVDMHRQWSLGDSRHLARLVRGSLGGSGAIARKFKGYSQFRVERA